MCHKYDLELIHEKSGLYGEFLTGNSFLRGILFPSVNLAVSKSKFHDLDQMSRRVANML